MGQIDQPVVSERATVIDSHHHTSAIAQIGDAHLGAKGECAMGSRQRALAEALTIGSCAAVEPRALPARGSLNHLDQLAWNG